MHRNIFFLFRVHVRRSSVCECQWLRIEFILFTQSITLAWRMENACCVDVNIGNQNHSIELQAVGGPEHSSMCYFVHLIDMFELDILNNSALRMEYHFHVRSIDGCRVNRNNLDIFDGYFNYSLTSFGSAIVEVNAFDSFFLLAILLPQTHIRHGMSICQSDEGWNDVFMIADGWSFSHLLPCVDCRVNFELNSAPHYSHSFVVFESNSVETENGTENIRGIQKRQNRIKLHSFRTLRFSLKLVPSPILHSSRKMWMLISDWRLTVNSIWRKHFEMYTTVFNTFPSALITIEDTLVLSGSYRIVGQRRQHSPNNLFVSFQM